MATENSHSDWWTPRDLVSALFQEFPFDLDAAASQENAICDPFISAEKDALKTPWDGRVVWCNPPYGKGNSASIKEFVQRGYEQHLVQKNTVVMLLPAYTDPKYWRDYCTQAHEIRFLTGRLAFLEAGQKKMSARFPSAIVIWKWIPGICYKSPNTWVWDWRAEVGKETV
jgi:phage N-6-adenine-methyltransferase